MSEKSDVLGYVAALQRDGAVHTLTTAEPNPLGLPARRLGDILNRAIRSGELLDVERVTAGVYRVSPPSAGPSRLVFAHVGYDLDRLPLVRSRLGLGRVVPVADTEQEQEGRG